MTPTPNTAAQVADAIETVAKEIDALCYRAACNGWGPTGVAWNQQHDAIADMLRAMPASVGARAEDESVIDKIESERQDAVDVLRELEVLLGKTPVGDEHANAEVVRIAFNRICQWRISAIAKSADLSDPHAVRAASAAESGTGEAFEVWFAEYVKSPALNANDCEELRQRTWSAWQAARALPSMAEGFNAGVEAAAKWHERQAFEADMEHPGVQGSKSQKRRASLHRMSADALRALAQPSASTAAGDGLTARQSLDVVAHRLAASLEMLIMDYGDVPDENSDVDGQMVMKDARAVLRVYRDDYDPKRLAKPSPVPAKEMKGE
jgi:hypothetical protein